MIKNRWTNQTDAILLKFKAFKFDRVKKLAKIKQHAENIFRVRSPQLLNVNYCLVDLLSWSRDPKELEYSYNKDLTCRMIHITYSPIYLTRVYCVLLMAQAFHLFALHLYRNLTPKLYENIEEPVAFSAI